jgi:hypothetical protein
MAEKETQQRTRPRKRAAAEPPAAGTGGIEHDLQARAAAAAQQAEAMKGASTGAKDQAQAPTGRPTEEPAQNLVPSQGHPEPAAESNAPEEKNQNSGIQETQNSGQTSGNPENQKSRTQEEDSGGDTGTTATAAPTDYLGMVYEGVVDPYDDFRKTSTQLPPVVSRTLKAAAPIHGISVQQLLRDIVIGRVKPLPESHPDLLERFYTMAKQGKLK